MSYAKSTVSVRGTEIEFIETFVSTLSAAAKYSPSADSMISAYVPDGYESFSAYLAAQFEQTDTNPTFDIILGGSLHITFTRQSSVSSSAEGYSISVDGMDTPFIIFSLNARVPSFVGDRTWKYSVAANANVVNLILGSYNASDDSLPFSFIRINGNVNGSAVSSQLATRAISTNFKLDNSTLIKKVDRLLYTYDTTSLNSFEYINNKVFIANNASNRVLTATSLIDISTVAKEEKVEFADKAYYSLDAHTLMEV